MQNLILPTHPFSMASSARQDGIELPNVRQTSKDNPVEAKKDIAVEVREDGPVDGAPKTYYSKLSIWLMILYSGLAIGSDG